MTQKELLPKDALNFLSEYIQMVLRAEVEDVVDEIKASAMWTSTIEEVQKTEKFQKELAETTKSITDRYVREKLNLGAWDVCVAKGKIDKEVNARLALTAIDTFDNVADNVIDNIQVEDYLMA